MRVSKVLFVSLASVLPFIAVLIGMGSTALAADHAATLPVKTALDDYIAKPDASYHWPVSRPSRRGCTVYLVDMTSQTWRTPQEVSRPDWQHWLIVAKPDKLAYDTAFLGVFGGGNDGNPPDPTKSMVVQIATPTKSVTVE